MNIALWLELQAQLRPQRGAIAWGTAIVHDYAGLAGAAARVAQALRMRGLAPGDRVGVFMANAPDYLVTLWGIWWAGAVAVPMNARLHAREAGWICGHSGQRLVVADAAHADALSAHRPAGCELLADGGAGLARPPAVAAPAASAGGGDRSGDGSGDGGERDPALPDLPGPVHRTADDPAWLFYTSGTTGRPKGVTLTHRNLRACTLAYTATVQSVGADDCFLHPAPLSHGSGLYHLPYVMNGGLNVIPRSPSLDEAECLALAAHWGRASTFAAPTIVRRLAAHAQARGDALPRGADGAPAGLATIVYGGAPMYLADLVAARQALGPHLAQIYGQGEAPMTITVLPRAVLDDTAHPRWAERAASVGHAQPVVEVSVRAPDGALLPTGGIGEVCVRGDVVMAGYWQDAAATAAALQGGWLRTGDIGRFDEHGFLTLLDRSKDLVISGGNNVYPREVEEVLLTHADVAEVSVIGRSDPQWGELLVAYVAWAGSAASPSAGPSAVEPEDWPDRLRDERQAMLDAHCLAQIARYKRPKGYRFVRALPKNHYGKVLKTTLREHEASLPEPGPIASSGQSPRPIGG